MQQFSALRVMRTHTIWIDAAIDTVFPLFTPKGEELWAEGWKPLYLFPEDGRTELGMVFLTPAEDERQTIWSVVEYDPAAHRIRYVRITPESRHGEVTVVCTSDGSRTRAQVTYRLTALGPRGNEYLAGLSESHFSADIDAWKTAIDQSLQLRQAQGLP